MDLDSSPNTHRVSQTLGPVPCSQRVTVSAVKALRPRVRSRILPGAQPRRPGAGSLPGWGGWRLPSALHLSLICSSLAPDPALGVGNRLAAAGGRRGTPGRHHSHPSLGPPGPHMKPDLQSAFQDTKPLSVGGCSVGEALGGQGPRWPWQVSCQCVWKRGRLSTERQVLVGFRERAGCQ